MSADVIAVNFARLSGLPLARILDGSQDDSVELLGSIRMLATELKTECEQVLQLETLDTDHRRLAQAGLEAAGLLLGALARKRLPPVSPVC